MNSIKSVVFVCLALLAGNTLADRAEDEATIRGALTGVKPSAINTTPITGLYEVVVGARVVYMSGDGQYMLQGELVDIRKGKNLTEPSRRGAIRELMSAMSEDDMIIFKPEKVKHVITVFTDIDCGYCRKLHNEMDQYLAEGIEIRYMMYPRAGVGSESYKKAVAVWCADDRNAALTNAKNGKPLDMKTCDNPVDRHLELVRQLGARGTPFIVLDNGGTQPGYVPARRLAKVLEETL